MLYEGKQLLYGTGNYIMYLRKSRKDIEAEQHGEGDTLTRHYNMLNALARQRRLNVTVILEEIVSGDTIAARPKMQKLLGLIESGSFDGVLVVEVERLSRGDTADQGIVSKTLKYSDTKVITPYKTYDPNNEFDEEYFEFGLFMSRREYSTIKRRLIRGSHASRSEGKFIGSVAPYGYKIVKLKKQKGYTLEIIPEEAEVVRLIFDLASGKASGTRLGRTKIADYLNDHGYRKAGKLWTAAMINTITINEVYKGYIVDGKRRQVRRIVNGETVISRPRDNSCTKYKGLHEAIVPEDQFDLVQSFTRSRCNASLNRNTTLQNPFSGLVFCSKCGRQMIRKPDLKMPASLRCNTRGCDTVSTYVHVFEKRVLEGLKNWISDYQITPEEFRSDEEEKAQYESNIAVLVKESEELHKQYENTYTLLERGIYTEEIFFRRNAAVKKDLEALQLQLNTLQGKLSALDEITLHKYMLVPKMQNIIDCYDSIDSAAGKNELLKEVIDHIEYTKEPDQRGKLDNFSIMIYPKLK